MKKIFTYFLAAAAVCSMASCGSDDNGDEPEPDKVELTGGQSDKVTCWANTTEGQITFKTSTSWSATVEAVSRAEVNWLHLDRSGGPAGDVTLTYAIDPNETGATRSANIVIRSRDASATVLVTQSPEANPDTPVKPFSGLKSVFKSGLVLQDLKSKENDLSFTYNESTCLLEKLQDFGDNNVFTYSGSTVTVKVYNGNTVSETYTIQLDGSLRFAKHIEHRWSGESDVHTYDFEYANGYLTKIVWVEGQGHGTTELKWENGDIAQVVASYYYYDEDKYGGEYKGTDTIDFTYTSKENEAGLMLYTSMFHVNFGEAEKFYFGGLLGYPTKHYVESSSLKGTFEGEPYEIRESCTYEFLNGYGVERPTKLTLFTDEEPDDDIPYTSKEEFTFKWYYLF